MYREFLAVVMRLAVVVNPDAGLGGKLGFKGSDGRAAEARAAGAQDRAGPRMRICLEKLAELAREPIEILAWDGRMGGDWIPGEYTSTGNTPETTDATSTSEFIKAHSPDLFLYAGGDGTTRDIVEALGEREIPLVGVPGGVKMHSGCFATTPKAAAEVVWSFFTGDLMVARTEVMDLDEEVYRKGEWKVRMYGEAFTPASPRWMQGAKEQVQRESEEETLEAMSSHVANLVEENPDLMLVWGSGGTLRQMCKQNGHESTLLGIDIQHAGKMYNDLNESGLLEIINQHQGEIKLLLSPMGGQGFLIGRGNLQLSPDVLRAIGTDNILGIATPAKLLGLNELRIDTGDEDLDAEIRGKKYLKVLQGYRTTRVIRVAND
ncbi:MAG: ATP-NAD kinase [Euryarchaeota archaeon]|nr:ATP-NAD kinase [Euryarchaeota archaeon]|tara:strand:+ start:12309 stop:13439 length:1131 start_codon:yes stop_codon:yes gene_type:complete